MNLALTADWLTVFGGAEHAILEFHKLWPEAPIFTTVARPNNLGPLKQMDIRVSHLQKWYNLIGKHQLLLPWMPRAVEDLDLSGFDVILSSSHAVGKGIIPPSTALHICYCHTPMRYAWEMEEDYLRDFRVPRFLRKKVKKELSILRRWDLSTAKRVDEFIANSHETQRRIKDIYGRESIVIPPPVDDRFFSEELSGSSEKSFYLALGRLVPYKKFDLLIELANKLQLPLHIAGTGQDEARLRSLAGPTVTFLGFVPEEQLASLYASAKALLFPQYEDAGIVPLEAQACGTPVIAYGKGGALDSIAEGKTGLFFQEQTAASMEEAIHQFEKLTFDAKKIRSHAEAFSATNFRKKILEAVEKFSSKKGRHL